MRGDKSKAPQALFPRAYSIADYIPLDHPLRPIKQMIDAELTRLSPVFAKAYSSTGRPSIAPEMLIKASVLQALYGIRSHRQLCQQIHYNMLFRWFLDMAADTKVFDHSTFSKNHQRFAEHGFMRKFFEGSVAQALQTSAIGGEEFSVDGTLIESWASMKSVQPKDEDDDDYDSGAWANFKGEKRTNQSHESKTDPEARLYRKGPGRETKLAHSAHVLMDNDFGLIVDAEMAEASGYAERGSAERMLKRVLKRHRIAPLALAADKGYDATLFIEEIEKHGTIPFIAMRSGVTTASSAARQECQRRNATTSGYWMARARRAIEKIFGWYKGALGMGRMRRKTRVAEEALLHGAMAVYNFMRMAKIRAM